MPSIQEKTALLGKLGELLAADFGTIVPDREFCRLAQKCHIDAFLYCASSGNVAPGFKSMKENYLHCNARQIQNEFALQQLYLLLEKAELPFVPIKGIDLAYRIYPMAAMRPFSDFDIWVRPGDIKKFCQLLEEDHWQCKLDYYTDHHLGVRKKSKFLLEPHFSLPNLAQVAPEKLWEETFPEDGKKFQRCLSPELNLIMLFQHNSIDYYKSGNLLKLLLDVEFLLRKEAIDWSKVTTLCREYQCPHPGILCEAFPEFFRDRHHANVQFDPAVVAAARELMLKSEKTQERDAALNRATAAPGKWSWWKTQFFHLSASNLRWKYPQIGDSTIKLHAYRFWDILLKTRSFWRHFTTKPAPQLEEHIQKSRLVDDSWKSL